MDIDHDKFQSVGDIANTIVNGLAAERVYSGGIITEPGIYRGVDIETYHSDPTLFGDDFSISSTGLRQVLNRPSAYWAFSPFNPKRFARKDKDEFNFGQAAHTLLLGENDFAQKFVMRPAQFDSYRTDAAKAWRDEAIAAGKRIITQEEIDTIRYIRDKLAGMEIIRNGLLNGRVERSIFHKRKGIWMKARPDVIPGASGDIVDLKTTGGIDTESLSRSVYNYGYFIQAGFIRHVMRAVLGEDSFASFSFVFVEKTPPYDVRIMQLKDVDIDLGEKEVLRGLDIVGECLKTGIWPGYDGVERDVQWIEIPSWARTRLEVEATRRVA